MRQPVAECRELVREIGVVQFSVANQFDLLSPNPVCKDTLTYPLLLSAADIELGTPAARANLTHTLPIDAIKISEVIRNLVAKSVRFTAEGRAVAVNICAATSVDRAAVSEKNSSPVAEKRGFRVKRAQLAAEKEDFSRVCNVVVEVSSTGTASVYRESVFQLQIMVMLMPIHIRVTVPPSPVCSLLRRTEAAPV